MRLMRKSTAQNRLGSSVCQYIPAACLYAVTLSRCSSLLRRDTEPLFVSDEVNQLFDTGQQCRLEVGIGANGRQDALPRVRDVGRGLMRPAQLGDDPMFPGLTTGNDRPALEPEAFRSHGLPHIDIRVAQDPDVRREVAQRSGLLNQLGLLGPGDEVVDENPEATTRAWCEVTNDGSEIVDTVKHLDHYPLDPQVVAPDLLDQLGVVPALDEDA